jgi:hypothetical protein
MFRVKLLFGDSCLSLEINSPMHLCIDFEVEKHTHTHTHAHTGRQSGDWGGGGKFGGGG